MAKIALWIIFVVGAFTFLTRKIGIMVGVEPVRFLHLWCFLPAALLGIRSWWRQPSFARAWPVISCVVLVWIGLLWADHNRSMRGLLIAGLVTMALPIGALIAERRAWWFCAKVYVYANVASLAYLFWCQYSDLGGRMSMSMMRIGLLRSADQSEIYTNPNQVGAQFAFAAILGFLLFLRSERYRDQPLAPGATSKSFGPWWAILLSLGCILTASRGAFVGWFFGMGVIILLGTRGLSDAKIRDLAAIMILGFSSTLFLAIASENTPWSKLYDRMVGDGNTSLGTMGNRTQIWTNAISTWWNDPESRILGVGTGQADSIAAHNDYLAIVDDYGQLRRNCHSAFIEWIVSYGIVGILLGICLMTVMGVIAWNLDYADGGIGRMALLVCFALCALTGGVIRRPDWIPCATLILAMLSMIPATKNVLPRPHFLDTRNDSVDKPAEQAA